MCCLCTMESSSPRQAEPKSFEAALYLHELLFGKEATQKTAGGLVIDWDVDEVPAKIVLPKEKA